MKRAALNRKSEIDWPGRLAWLLCGLTLPLIGVGGLITTTDAGMAVPDWPGTYGWNMFLYPWETWFFGPWDLFIEHGHRLLASLVGFVSIALVVCCFGKTGRPLLPLALAALGLVIFQGVLGGLRVTANERLLAMAHGVTGPLFFALTCWIVARSARRLGPVAASRSGVSRLAAAVAGLVLIQLTLGAALRHIPESAGPWDFATLTNLHLGGAVVVVGVVLWLAGRLLTADGLPRGARVAGGLIGGVVLLQLAAGVGAWVLKYGLPAWADGPGVATMEATVAGGLLQTYTVTAHQVGGSLLLGLSVYAAARTLAGRRAAPPALEIGGRLASATASFEPPF